MANKYECDIHPLAMLMPDLSPEDRALLLGDIRENGLLEPITLHEGKILDGRSRYSICKSIQYPFKDTDFVTLPVGVDPLTFVISKNIVRRHLSAEGKRDLIRGLLAKFPNLSSRAIARMVGVSDHTVEAVRQEATAQSAQLEAKRVGADGKARKKPKSSGPSAKALMKQLAKFKEQWEGFNEHQKRDFIKTFKDEIAEMLEYIEARDEVEDDVLVAEGIA
jgi:ParB-like chromosome segregation protein Spo0J